MANLARPRTLPLLRSYYLEDPDPNMAEFCDKVTYLNQIEDPLLAQWKAEASENWAKQQKIIENLEQEWAAGQAAKAGGWGQADGGKRSRKAASLSQRFL